MSGTSLFALIDDISSILDKVAIQTQSTFVKTSGVVGDDLAVSANQVNGVKPERELPIVWSIAKGSLKNKAIIIPIALAFSYFAPALIPWILVVGGLYLVYEGGEGVVEHFSRSEHQDISENTLLSKNLTKEELEKIEKDKIQGAIKTDMVLSGEIIVIALGTMHSTPFVTQMLTLIGVGIGLTVGVYGVVAGIVKADDIGLHLMQKPNKTIQNWIGRQLVYGMPYFMKVIATIGSIAMFTVGGGILLHNIPFLHHLIDLIPKTLSGSWIGNVLIEYSFGIMIGVLLFMAHQFLMKIFFKLDKSS